MPRSYKFTLIILLLFVLAGCRSKSDIEDPQPAPTLDPVSAAGQGEVLFRTHCAICHSLEEETRIIGPSLAHIATTASNRVPGKDAETYLVESITHPDAHIVEGYAPGSMQQNFTSYMDDVDIQQVVAYLMTLD